MAKPNNDYQKTWTDIIERIADEHNKGAYHLGGISNTYQAQEAGKAAFREFLLECFFDTLIIDKSANWHELSTEQAIQHELIKRHGWQPAEIKKLSKEELLTIFHDDLMSLKLPKSACIAC